MVDRQSRTIAGQADADRQWLLSVLSEWQRWGVTASPVTPAHCRLLTGGQTNTSWRLQTAEGELVLRHHAANSDQLDIRRDDEFRIQTQAAEAGLAPSIRYRDPRDRYWLIDFVSGPGLGEVLQQAQDNGAVAATLGSLQQALARLHQLRPSPLIERLDVADKASVYWDLIAERFSQLDWHHLQNRLQQSLGQWPGGEPCYVHMDPNPENWVRTERGWYLLDWEYATVGHPLWDMTGLLVAADWPVAWQQQWCELTGDSHQASWQLALAQQQYFSLLWYGAQGQLTAEQLYRQLQQLAVA